jgi:hypothetical protein
MCYVQQLLGGKDSTESWEMIDGIERRKRTESEAGEEKNQKQKEVV